MSQLELETAIEASPGMVSRIENGVVNPTKETMDKIGSALNMNHRELSYVSGRLASPASENEIKLALAEIEDHFNDERVLAYVLDDRYRVLAISKGFVNLFRTYVKDADQLGAWAIGHSVLRLTLDENFGVAKFLYTENFEQAWSFQLARFKLEMGFMVDDEYFKEGMACINKNKLSRKVWEKVQKEIQSANTLDSKKVKLDLEGQMMSLGFAREPIAKYPRFETLEFFSMQNG